MIKVTFVSADGTRRTVEIDEGLSAREAALFNSVPGIDGDCGGVCACATCHVHVDLAWMDRAEIGRAHVRTPVTNPALVCRLLLDTQHTRHTNISTHHNNYPSCHYKSNIH